MCDFSLNFHGCCVSWQEQLRRESNVEPFSRDISVNAITYQRTNQGSSRTDTLGIKSFQGLTSLRRLWVVSSMVVQVSEHVWSTFSWGIMPESMACEHAWFVHAWVCWLNHACSSHICIRKFYCGSLNLGDPLIDAVFSQLGNLTELWATTHLSSWNPWWLGCAAIMHYWFVCLLWASKDQFENKQMKTMILIFFLFVGLFLAAD